MLQKPIYDLPGTLSKLKFEFTKQTWDISRKPCCSCVSVTPTVGQRGTAVYAPPEKHSLDQYHSQTQFRWTLLEILALSQNCAKRWWFLGQSAPDQRGGRRGKGTLVAPGGQNVSNAPSHWPHAIIMPNTPNTMNASHNWILNWICTWPQSSYLFGITSMSRT